MRKNMEYHEQRNEEKKLVYKLVDEYHLVGNSFEFSITYRAIFINHSA